MPLLAMLILLTSCNALDLNRTKEPTSPGRASELESEYNRRLALYTGRTLATQGWPSDSDCDGTKWAGEACAGGAAVAIARAEYSPGEIHRRPGTACWNAGQGDVGSKTTVSRDILEPYMACLWRTGDLAGLQRLADYGEARDWLMGEPPVDPRVYLGTNLIGLLGRMIYALSLGDDDRYYRRLFKIYPEVTEDYEQELQALGIQLQGEVTEELRALELDPSLEVQALLDINDQMLARLEGLARADPDNAYFHAVLGVYTGDLARATELLLDAATPVPSYVRGDNPEAFAEAHWLLAARTVLQRYGEIP